MRKILKEVRRSIQKIEVPDKRKKDTPAITVVCILDRFSYECFQYECNLIQLSIKNWKLQIEEEKPAFLFVESAWRGINDEWRNKLVNLTGEMKNEITELIFYCNANNIPTVFWNKEDPPNYGHFIQTAKLFDYIFTSDSDCVEKYKKDLKHNNVFTLPFAAQPRIHNPINRNKAKKFNLAFAGSWYEKKHLQRKEDMDVLLKPSLKYGCHIFDRNHGLVNQKNNIFPKLYQKSIIGSLDYLDMTIAYKLYNVFLNVNSVRESPSMFSRRVFEVLASGTVVVSTYSKGIEMLFPGIVPIVHHQKETESIIKNLLNDSEKRSKLGLLGIREIYNHHLYSHRFKEILTKINTLEIPKDIPKKVSVISLVKNINYIDHVLENYSRQDWMEKELILLVINNQNKINKTLKQKMEKYQDISAYFFNRPLKELQNFVKEKISGDYVTYFNESDFYSTFYLRDLMHAFQYTTANIIGKINYYSYNTQKKELKKVENGSEYSYLKVTTPAFIAKKNYLNLTSQIIEENGLVRTYININKSHQIFVTDSFNYLMIIDETKKTNSKKGLLLDKKITSLITV